MKKNLLIKSLTVILLSLTFSSCSIFGGDSNLNNLIRTFYVGEGGTQYYVKPMTFESKDGNDMFMDITFRYKDELKDSAAINFTITSEQLIKTLDNVTISNNTSTFVTNQYELLFAEKDGDYFKSRFSFKIPMNELDKLIKDQSWKLALKNKETMLAYFSTSNTQDILKTLNDDLFVIFR